MEAKYITLTKENIEKEHICCAFSDKKCKDSYELKKTWLKNEFENGYVFRRLDERAKVFIEYGPAEKAWVPVNAPNYLMINCFWVSGKYKGCGHGKALLQSAVEDAKAQGRDGLASNCWLSDRNNSLSLEQKTQAVCTVIYAIASHKRDFISLYDCAAYFSAQC